MVNRSPWQCLLRLETTSSFSITALLFLGGQVSYTGLHRRVMTLYCKDLEDTASTFRRKSKVWGVQLMILSLFRS